MTLGIFGRSGSGSSESDALQSSLANRLRVVTDLLGSTLYRLTWKVRVTPLGCSIYALRASGRRTSDSGFTSWPTPNAGPQNDTDSRWQERREEIKASGKYGPGHNSFGLTLGMASQLASWPTPMAGTPAQKGYNEAGNTDSGRKTVALAAWPTPNTPSGGRSMSTDKMDATGRTVDGKKHTASLEHAVRFASWKTPHASAGVPLAVRIRRPRESRTWLSLLLGPGAVSLRVDPRPAKGIHEARHN